MPLRVLDPSGVTVEWVKSQFPDAVVHRVPDEEGPYDAAMLYGDLDNRIPAAARIDAICQHVKRPDGRVYVCVPEGTVSGRFGERTAGRRRAWRSIDVADLLRRFGNLQELGVDDDGYVSAVMSPIRKEREIAVWTGYTIGPWDPMDIVGRGLGGSETAAYRIAEMFAEMGHIVTLYGQFRQEGAVKDVILKDFRNFDPTIERRAVVAFRDSAMFDVDVNADTTVLWLEDVAGAEGLTPERAERVNYVCGVSEWHRRNILEVHPWLPPEKAVASRNGITHSFFEGEQPEREPRLLYTSSPDRGLHIVLECWPEIKRRVPEATFRHTYGPWYDIVANVRQDAKEYRARCRQMTEEYEGVKAVGPLGQRDLAMLMRSSLVWCAPSHFMNYSTFDETSCISAMEAQAAGCRIVCNDRGALSETVKTGLKIPGDPTTPEWREEFIDGIVAGLTDPEVQQVAQTEGPEATKALDWYGVCLQLEGLFGRQDVPVTEDGRMLAPA